MEITRKKIGQYFHWTLNFEFIDLAEKVVKSSKYYNGDVREALDYYMGYYHWQWVMIKFYCIPQQVDYDLAYEEFVEDLENILNGKEKKQYED